MRITYINFVILFLSYLNSVVAVAKDLTFCFETWEPYATENEKKENVGISVEFYTKVVEKMGHKITFKQLPPARCGYFVGQGQYDGLILNTPGSVKDVIDTNITTDYWVLSAIVATNSPLTHYTGIEQFKGKKVGVTTSYVYPDELKNFEGMTKDMTEDSKNSLKKIAAGRLDVIFEDPVWTEVVKKELNIELKILTPPTSMSKNCVSFSKKNADLVPEFEKTAQSLIDSGLLDELYKKYMKMTFKEFKTKYGI